MAISDEYFRFLESDEVDQENQIKTKAAEKLQEKLDKFKGSSDPRECKTCGD